MYLFLFVYYIYIILIVVLYRFKLASALLQSLTTIKKLYLNYTGFGNPIKQVVQIIYIYITHTVYAKLPYINRKNLVIIKLII